MMPQEEVLEATEAGNWPVMAEVAEEVKVRRAARAEWETQEVTPQ